MRLSAIGTYVVPPAADGRGSGDIAAHAGLIIVRVTAANGVAGYGEVPTGVTEPRDGAGSVLDQIAAAARAMIGLDGGNLNLLSDLLGRLDGCGLAARAALDMAAHDLVGRAWQVPVHTLLGGALRTRLEVMSDLGDAGLDGASPPVGAGAFVARLGAAGTSAAAEAARRRLEALVAAAARSGARIEIDAQETFSSPGQVRRFMEPIMRLAVLGHLSLRQPLHRHDLEGHALLRETLPIDLVVDRSVMSPEIAMQIVRRGAADRLVVALDRLGGLDAARRVSDICEAAGVGVSVASPPSAGIQETAQCHLAAILRDPYPIGLASRPGALASAVTRGFELVGAEARLSDRPGLGIEVDEAALRPVVVVT